MISSRANQNGTKTTEEKPDLNGEFTLLKSSFFRLLNGLRLRMSAAIASLDVANKHLKADVYRTHAYMHAEKGVSKYASTLCIQDLHRKRQESFEAPRIHSVRTTASEEQSIIATSLFTFQSIVIETLILEILKQASIEIRAFTCTGVYETHIYSVAISFYMLI